MTSAPEAELARRVARECYGVDGPLELVRAHNAVVHRLRLADGARIVKLARDGDPSPIAKELAVFEILKRHDIPLPVIEHADASGERVGRAFFTMRSAGDTTVLEHMDEATGGPRLFAEMGTVLARIHSIALPAPRDATRDPLAPRDWTQELERLRALARRLAGFGVIDRTGADLFATQSMPDPDGHALCHGDFHGVHCVVTAGSIVAVIDWERAWRGAPDIDLAITQAYLDFYAPPSARHGFRAGYDSVRRIGDDHDRRTLGVRLAHVLSIAEYVRALGREDDLRRAVELYRAYCRLAMQ